jgi:hypothetical protein
MNGRAPAFRWLKLETKTKFATGGANPHPGSSASPCGDHTKQQNPAAVLANSQHERFFFDSFKRSLIKPYRRCVK